MKNNHARQVGLWMDHSKAHVVEYSNGAAVLVENIDSPVESIKRIEGEVKDTTRFTSSSEHSSNNEHKKHNIAQKELNEYFRILENKLSAYDDILIFGPGVAKEQFRNRLRDNKGFSDKWLSLQSSDKLTENQLLAFVRDFYKESNP
jgi:stalled ribosome rescue protein Dom34